jgi:tetratricopeptide (TPR) repeat protein
VFDQSSQERTVSHISRKELKKDEIREGIVHGAEAALAHQKEIWIYGAIALAVVLAITGWRFYSQRQTVKAAAAFEEASKIFNARIRMMNEPEQPGEITYVDEKNKFTDAAKKFEEVAQAYGSTRPGQMAQYYAGLCQQQLGQHDKALEWFSKVQSGGDAELAALSRLRAASVYAMTGKSDEAVKAYQQLLANPTTMVPKPLVMLALADHYLRSNPAEAEKLYNQIREEFPGSQVAEEAQGRLDSLPPKT